MGMYARRAWPRRCSDSGRDARLLTPQAERRQQATHYVSDISVSDGGGAHGEADIGLMAAWWLLVAVSGWS